MFASGLGGTADYSGGDPIGWKVPKYTAISVSFSPRRKIKPKELGLDLRYFKKTEIYDVPEAFSFENEDLGIDFVVNRNGFVEDFGFLPVKCQKLLALLIGREIRAYKLWYN